MTSKRSQFQPANQVMQNLCLQTKCPLYLKHSKHPLLMTTTSTPNRMLLSRSRAPRARRERTKNWYDYTIKDVGREAWKYRKYIPYYPSWGSQQKKSMHSSEANYYKSGAAAGVKAAWQTGSTITPLSLIHI